MEKQRKLSGFYTYLFIGGLGIASQYPLLLAEIEKISSQLPADLAITKELLVIQPLILNVVLMLITLIIGYSLAHKVRLKSALIHEQQFFPALQSGLKAGIIGGAVMTLIILVFDLFFHRSIPDGHLDMFQPPNWLKLLAGLLYGGIVEELLMRWGIMTLIVFVLWKLFQRNRSTPSPHMYWISIIISAILFGLLHYSANVLAGPMTLIVWVRMILLNGLGGVIFGWLYWRKNLESAIVAHMVLHATWFIGKTVIYYVYV